MTLKRDFWSQLKDFSFRHGLTMQNLYRFAFKAGLADWRRMVDKKESAESLMRKLFLSYNDIDWDRTQAFAFGGFGQIYLNVKESTPVPLLQQIFMKRFVTRSSASSEK